MLSLDDRKFLFIFLDIAAFLERLEHQYQEKIWDFNQKAAHWWGQITARCANHDLDAQIASIALTNGAAVVTRNTKDFQFFLSALAPLGVTVPLINPFDVR